MPTSFPIPKPHAPTGFVDQAALDTAFTDPLNDLYALVAAINASFLGEGNSASTVTLATASAFAGLGPVTFTLTATTRVIIFTSARYALGSATAGRMSCQSSYNTGASPVIGSAIGVGKDGSICCTVTSLAGSGTCFSIGSALLTPGTYTAYPSVTRAQGGSATDIAGTFETVVLGLGGV